MKKTASSKEPISSFPEAQLLETNGNEQKAYDSVLIPPLNMSVFGSKLSLNIIKELVKEPGCAMDISRSLGEHEQKIYYHLRRLEKAGIVKLKHKEKRYGMTAKIFRVVSPVISTKLYDHGRDVKTSYALRNPKMEKILHPFVEDGKLNAKIVIGDPYPHGEYDSAGKGAVHVFDFISIIGKFTENIEFPMYKLDTFVKEGELRENIILIGNIKDNTIINKINSKLPVYFDMRKTEMIVSKNSKKIFRGPRIGFILKCDNPLNKRKKILILGGIRTRGVQAANIAITQNFEKLIKGLDVNENFHRILESFDKDGDGFADSVNILE